MTSTLDRPNCPTVHGPAEVRAAMVACTNELGLESFDRQMDDAYREGLEALAKFLDYWWACSQVAAGNGSPEDYGLHPVRGGREATVAAWEAAHPGEKLYAA
jgi:hypothetical protein